MFIQGLIQSLWKTREAFPWTPMGAYHFRVPPQSISVLQSCPGEIPSHFLLWGGILYSHQSADLELASEGNFHSVGNFNILGGGAILLESEERDAIGQRRKILKRVYSGPSKSLFSIMSKHDAV
ncbi:60S ribosomal protein L32 [Platysternon megacephalum]|uniref:60S ribosomal protein L32 n=1 Tax=Platysternon megacephalum TaxID=55544 RepID=A0A4D9EA38_9SAUR|nr:60S ribosomal protein L32 [Platysternon megacephalum]